MAAWGRAEASGLDLDSAAGRLAKGLPATGEPVAVLRDRVDRWHEVARSCESQEQAMIAGLIPAADRVADPEMRQALAERAALIL